MSLLSLLRRWLFKKRGTDISQYLDLHSCRFMSKTRTSNTRIFDTVYNHVYSQICVWVYVYAYITIGFRYMHIYLHKELYTFVYIKYVTYYFSI